MARELDRGLQLQKHNIVVMVQVSGAALVLRVGNRTDYVPHLLSSLYMPQGMLAQVDSVSTVDAGTGWLEEKMSPSPAPSLPHLTFLISKHISFHINSNPIQILYFKSIPILNPLSPPKPHSHPFPSQPERTPSSSSNATPPSPITIPSPFPPGTHILLQTVCCSEDPSGVDEDRPTEQPPLYQQGYLPRLRVGRAGVTTWEKPIGPVGAIDNLGILLRDAW